MPARTCAQQTRSASSCCPAAESWQLEGSHACTPAYTPTLAQSRCCPRIAARQQLRCHWQRRQYRAQLEEGASARELRPADSEKHVVNHDAVTTFERTRREDVKAGAGESRWATRIHTGIKKANFERAVTEHRLACSAACREKPGTILSRAVRLGWDSDSRRGHLKCTVTLTAHRNLP